MATLILWVINSDIRSGSTFRDKEITGAINIAEDNGILPKEQTSDTLTLTTSIIKCWL